MEDSPVSAPLLLVMSLAFLSWLVSTAPLYLAVTCSIWFQPAQSISASWFDSGYMFLTSLRWLFFGFPYLRGTRILRSILVLLSGFAAKNTGKLDSSGSRVHSSSCGALCGVVHSPFQFWTSLPLPLSFSRALRRQRVLRGVCVAMSCGGGFTADGTYDSVWVSVKPVTGNSSYYFQYQRCWVCLHAEWLVQQHDTICADNYIYFRFKLQACVSVRSGSCICMAFYHHGGP